MLSKTNQTNKPGAFATRKRAFTAVGSALICGLVGWALVSGMVLLFIRFPNTMVRVIAGTGICCCGYLLGRAFWYGGKGARLWGTTLALLSLMLAMNILGVFR